MKTFTPATVLSPVCTLIKWVYFYQWIIPDPKYHFHYHPTQRFLQLYKLILTQLYTLMLTQLYIRTEPALQILCYYAVCDHS